MCRRLTDYSPAETVGTVDRTVRGVGGVAMKRTERHSHRNGPLRTRRTGVYVGPDTMAPVRPRPPVPVARVENGAPKTPVFPALAINAHPRLTAPHDNTTATSPVSSDNDDGSIIGNTDYKVPSVLSETNAPGVTTEPTHEQQHEWVSATSLSLLHDTLWYPIFPAFPVCDALCDSKCGKAAP